MMSNTFIIKVLLSIYCFAFITPLFFQSYAAHSEAHIYHSQWGTYGDGDGEFNLFVEAVGTLTTDSDNNVYVADSNNHRIQKFNADGGHLATWGSYGTDDGEFNTPLGIAVDSDNNVYVADIYNDRIQKFNADGDHLATWGSYGTGNGQFEDPFGIAVDADNNVYVSDVNNYRIQKFTADGTFITSWGSSGTGDGQFDFPAGIAVDSDNNVYVADGSNYRIQKFTADGDFITTWGSSGTGDGQFLFATWLAIDAANYVYVSDAGGLFGGENRIQKFTADGDFVISFGTTGDADGQFAFPGGLFLDSNHYLYILDAGAFSGSDDRLQKFSHPGFPESYDNSISDNTELDSVVNQSSHRVSSTQPSPKACQSLKPASIPDLFQINSSSTTAELFFTPLSDTNQYFISFSEEPLAEQHGTQVTLSSLGVQNLTVNFLKPQTTYYFKVRGQNDCMPGDWSQTMMVKTTYSSWINKMFYFY